MERIPAPGDIYRHFKGNLYRVITVAIHSETEERLVVYQGLYGDYPVYARPLSMFMEKVDREKYPQVSEEYRFTRLPLTEVCGQQPITAVQSTVQPQTEEDKEAAGNPAGSEADEEFALNPVLLAFLDADSYERKLEIFDSMQAIMDQSMLNTVAISLDLEVSEGSLEEQYQTLRNCMLTLEKYECNRLR